MSITSWTNLATSIARSGAITAAERQFLNGNKTEFKHLWQLVRKATLYGILNHDEMIEEVEEYLATLVALAKDADMDPSPHMRGKVGKTGLNTYRTVNSSERIVIFSDLHITGLANRQGFFHNSGNKALYIQVLQDHYADRDFTLVENGDVEELLIYEPVLSEVEGMRNWEQDEIDALRKTKKRDTMQEIVSDHEDFYRTIYDLFVARNRYFRTTGNHDYDLANNDFVAIIENVLGVVDWPTASDAVLLTNGKSPDYVICHGHQFDTSCVPTHANFLGENYSQGSAWAFQGPDRFWTEIDDGPDFMHRWLDGSLAYTNMLVTADVDRKGLSEQYVAALGNVIGTLNKAEGWEALYGKNIAWEYFTNSGDAKAAMKEEIESGKRWIKFRHMDEIRIVDALDKDLGSSGPTLILGHSHEPRFNSGTYRGPDLPPLQHANYINSAAAGRFQNLIWGVEIEERRPKIISWHRDLNTGQPIKTVWGDYVHPVVNTVSLRPTQHIPMVESPQVVQQDTSSAWLASTFPLFA